MTGKAVLKLVLKRVDVVGLLVDDLLLGVLLKKLDEVVADTENSLDDALVVLVRSTLETHARTELQKLLDKLTAE